MLGTFIAIGLPDGRAFATSGFQRRVLFSGQRRSSPGMTNSWAGAVVPFGVDALVLYLASTYGEVFWIIPLIVTMGSLASNALTYWIGHCVGDAGLPRLLAPRHLDRMKASVQKTGAGRLAAAAVLPPPFPLTPFVLTCGALDLDRRRFFLVFGVMRLIRFTTLALLARHYGDRVRNILESQELQTGVTVLVFVTLAVMIATIVVLFRRTRPLLA